MANNEEIEIKVSVDTSDVDKSFKDIEKASDKMAKNVTKDADKVEDSMDDIKKSTDKATKSMKDMFRGVNIKQLTSSLSIKSLLVLKLRSIKVTSFLSFTKLLAR